MIEIPFLYSTIYIPQDFALNLNMYKIWRPLHELLLHNQIETDAVLLELGPGPGSSTFGVIEFYRLLAEENKDTIFHLRLELVEQHQEFIDNFSQLYNGYQHVLPQNLQIVFQYHCDDILHYLENNHVNYDLIYESNVFNSNEHIKESELPNLAEQLCHKLTPHGSLVLIEPANPEQVQVLKRLKYCLRQQGMTCFSPCNCDQTSCDQFASARIDITSVQLYKKLYEADLIRKRQDTHSFEYAVLRTDGLKKYHITNTGIPLSDIGHHIGERVRLGGFIITCLDDGPILSVKICDGSLDSNQQVWVKIPKQIMEESSVHCLLQGRGCFLKVKKALVESRGKLSADFSTAVEIMR